MGAISYRDLKRQRELDGSRVTEAKLSAAIDKGFLKPEDFSIRQLAEALVPDGREWVEECVRPGRSVSVRESFRGIDTTAFINITGQFVFKKILDRYESPEFVLSRLVPVKSADAMTGDRIPGLDNTKGNSDPIKPNHPYPMVGFGETFVDTPALEKHGFAIGIPREVVYFDLTGQVLSQADQQSEQLALLKEIDIAKVVVGVTNSYKLKGTTYNTYYASGDGQQWINKIGGNTLSDWTDVDAAEQLLSEMTDPATGNPILVQARDLVVTPRYKHAANRIIGAKEIRYTDSSTQTLANNPISDLRVAVSQIIRQQLIASGISAANASKYWFMGDFAKAFAWKEAWPLTMEEMSSPADGVGFLNDTVAIFKGSYMGIPAVIDPHYVVMSYES